MKELELGFFNPREISLFPPPHPPPTTNHNTLWHFMYLLMIFILHFINIYLKHFQKLFNIVFANICIIYMATYYF